MTTRFKTILMVAGRLLLVLELSSGERNPGKTKAEKISYLVEKAVSHHELTGNVLVIDNGQVLHQKSYGMANARLGIPNTDSTKFLIASLSKPFTAILILKLVEQGRMSCGWNWQIFSRIEKSRHR
ncbi:Beta-lactamase [Dyadobacter sp. SG02]|nr:serine hydrolase domain-containing protein [Dyadobacter sp. SG02]SEI50209.1 Beta-lactamase [Dyadobacter sp. SG02]